MEGYVSQIYLYFNTILPSILIEIAPSEVIAISTSMFYESSHTFSAKSIQIRKLSKIGKIQERGLPYTEEFIALLSKTPTYFLILKRKLVIFQQSRKGCGCGCLLYIFFYFNNIRQIYHYTTITIVNI